ncbi:unnamed protein product, partial [Choristocarpus tenellus]
RRKGFLERQQLEYLARECRREKRQMEVEDERRHMADGGQWINSMSRLILSRSRGKRNNGVAGNIFERLSSSRQSIERSKAPINEDSDNSWWRGSWSRKPMFHPTIDPHSERLVGRLGHRTEDIGERLYHESEIWERKREQREILLEESRQREACSKHVSLKSRRILARQFEERMRKIFHVGHIPHAMLDRDQEVDPYGEGWVTINDFEQILDGCEMLPPPQQNQALDQRRCRDNLLLDVWSALSQAGGRNGNLQVVSLRCLAPLLVDAAGGGNQCFYDKTKKHNKGEYYFPQFSRCSGRQTIRRMWQDSQQSLADVYNSNKVRRFGQVGQDGRSGQGEQDRSRDLGGKRDSKGDKSSGNEGTWDGDGQESIENRVARKKTEYITVAQAEALSARLNEERQLWDLKVNALRCVKEVQLDLEHTFEPRLNANASFLAMRHKERREGLIQDLSGEKKVEGEFFASKVDHRTTEERELEERCTFKPHLHRPKTKSWGGTSLLSSPPDQVLLKPGATSDKITATVTGDSIGERSAHSWALQVNRIRAGRLMRLHQIESNRRLALRMDSLSPSMQELFDQVGVELKPLYCDDQSSRRGGIPPRLSLNQRMANRRAWEEQCQQKRYQKLEEEKAQQDRRRRATARAAQRAGAIARLKKSLLTARGAGEGDPVMVVELKLVQEGRWVLLPLWGNSSPTQVVEMLMKRENLSGHIAHELEALIQEELASA